LWHRGSLGLVAFLLIRNAPFADPNFVTVLRIVLAVAAGSSEQHFQVSLAYHGKDEDLRFAQQVHSGFDRDVGVLAEDDRNRNA